MKILLLGAGGFIGTNIVERLLSDGVHRVTALDISQEKLATAEGQAGFTFLHHDIRQNHEQLEEWIQSHDLVIDLVAVANPSLYVTDPIGVFNLNFTENLKIVELCVKHRKRIIQFSSCEVYGKTLSGALGKAPSEAECPFHEDTTPLIMGPVGAHRWIYASAKQLLERVLHAYGLQHQLNYTIIRPFNFIGPRIDYLPSECAGNPRVFSHFMNALLYGTPMKLVDGGANYRSYTYIGDAVECVIRIIENPGGVCDRQIFNVGSSGNELSIRQLAERMKALFRRQFYQAGDPEPEIISVSSEEFYGPGYEDCDRRIPDVSKAQRLLGWTAQHDLESTLLLTMSYFVKRHREKSNFEPGVLARD